MSARRSWRSWACCGGTTPVGVARRTGPPHRRRGHKHPVPGRRARSPAPQATGRAVPDAAPSRRRVRSAPRATNDLHQAEISTWIAAGAYAVVVCDGAGWHQTGGELCVPDNIVLLHLLPYSPELNPTKTSGPTCAPTSSAPSSRTATKTFRRRAGKPGCS